METQEKLDFFRSHLRRCLLCPRDCGVDRQRGDVGFCRAGRQLQVSSYCLHSGEEPPISGTRGSGAIFFTHCNMACVYCQNYPISQLGYGNYVEVPELTRMMIELQRRGAHNINLVTPTHFLPHIVEAIIAGREQGLTVPIVYNSSGYESVQTIRMLEGIVQIYLVDMRYSTNESAIRYSNAPDYPYHNRLAVKEMVNQVGHLTCRQGLGKQGVIIRHLLLPSLMSETQEILEFIAKHISTDIPLSLMSQYFPANRTDHHPELNRKITRHEYDHATSLLERWGLEEGWIQDPDSIASSVA